MLPMPNRPMNRPWPVHSGQGGPSVDSNSPHAIITEPNMTVQRVPTRLATCPIRMPPPPAQSHAAALAAAGTARAPPTSAAMSLSATVLIHTPPNAIVSTASAVTAMRQDCAVSIDRVGEAAGIVIPADRYRSRCLEQQRKKSQG